MKESYEIHDFFKYDLKVHDESVLNLISRNVKEYECKKGDQLLRAGQPTDSVYILVSGKARGYIIDEDGRDITFRFAYKPGDILLNDNQQSGKYNYYWEALSKSVFVSVPGKTLVSAFERDPDFRAHLIAFLSNQFEQESALRYALVTMQAKERYLWFRETYPEFPAKIPQKYVATYLNMLPQTLSEVRGMLNSER